MSHSRCAIRTVTLFAACHVALSATIVPEFDPSSPHWLDTDGNRIEAHAAGMLQNPKDSKWYWYGETKKTDDLSTHGVSCYSADTIAGSWGASLGFCKCQVVRVLISVTFGLLLFFFFIIVPGPWTFEGFVLNQTDIVAPGQAGPFVVERPKVLYNKKNDNFVMWFHLDDAGYQYRHTGVAVSATPNGHFKFQYGFQPDGIPSLDMSLFLDPLDGQAYFVRSCDNQYAGISRLDEDFLNSTGIISTHDVCLSSSLYNYPMCDCMLSVLTCGVD